MTKLAEVRFTTAKQEKAYEGMLPAAQQAFRKIYTKTSNLATTDLLTRWEIGEIVLEGMTNERMYGAGVAKQWAAALGEDVSEIQLYQYRRFANMFSRQDLVELLSRRSVKGGQLAWSHIRALLPLERGAGVTQARQQLVERIFAEGLSCTQVGEAVREHLGEALSKGGAKPATPKTPKAAMLQVEKFASAIVNRAEIWDRSLWRNVGEGPAENCTEALLSQLEKTRAAQVEAQERLAELTARADAAIERVRRVISRGVELPKVVAPATEAEQEQEIPQARIRPAAVAKSPKKQPNGPRIKPGTAVSPFSTRGATTGRTPAQDGVNIRALGRPARVPVATAAMLEQLQRPATSRK